VVTEVAAVSNKIARMTPTGMVTEFPIPTTFEQPNWHREGCGRQPVGSTEHDGHKIGASQPAGVITEFPIASGGKPSSIVAASTAPSGSLSRVSRIRIGRITSAGAISEYQVPTSNSDPTGITAGPDKNVWFSELSSKQIGQHQ